MAKYILRKANRPALPVQSGADGYFFISIFRIYMDHRPIRGQRAH